jgi:hypothetical protein
MGEDFIEDRDFRAELYNPYGSQFRYGGLQSLWRGTVFLSAFVPIPKEVTHKNSVRVNGFSVPPQSPL